MKSLSRWVHSMTCTAILCVASSALSQGLYTTRDDKLFRFNPNDLSLIEVGPIGLPAYEIQSLTFIRQVGLLALGILPSGDTILARLSPFDGRGTVLASLGNGSSQGYFSAIERVYSGFYVCHATPASPSIKRLVGGLGPGGSWYENYDTRRDNDFMVWNSGRSLITWDPNGEPRYGILDLFDGSAYYLLGSIPFDLGDGAYDEQRRITYIVSTENLRLYSMTLAGGVATTHVVGDLSGPGVASGLAWVPSLDRVFGTAIMQGEFYGYVPGDLEVQVWQDGAHVETISGNYGQGSRFAFSPTVSGPLVLKFRHHTSLWKAVNVTLGETPIENLVVGMTNGDCDHDNEVSIGDFAVLSKSYGLGWWDNDFDTNADLNGDEWIDLSDYAILSASYGEVGD